MANASVEVTVSYLPATQPFHQDYAEAATIGTVQADAMNFFGVRDFQNRDRHQFFLEFDRQRLTNASETLQQLLGQRHGAHFNLVEQVTQG